MNHAHAETVLRWLFVVSLPFALLGWGCALALLMEWTRNRRPTMQEMREQGREYRRLSQRRDMRVLIAYRPEMEQ